MKGYQYLENDPSTRPLALLRVVLSKRSASKDDFFALCKTREIGRIPMLLYIYLRGLYCRFQKPIFFCFDKQIKDHLGISQSTLARARQFLQKRGVIKFYSGKGSKPTEYTMLGTVLLPIIKKTTPYRHTQVQGYRQNDDTIYTSKERLKNKVGNIFQGMTTQDRDSLKEKGIL
ncbi:hypothetical protein ACFL0T_03880 [Candidatus Omnitrophota bacterium]